MTTKYISKEKFQRVARLHNAELMIATKHKAYHELVHAFNGIRIRSEEETTTALVVKSEGYYYYEFNSGLSIRFIRSRFYPKYVLGEAIPLNLLIDRGSYTSGTETKYQSRIFGLKDIKDK